MIWADELIELGLKIRPKYQHQVSWLINPYAHEMCKWAVDPANAGRSRPSKRERREMRIKAALARRLMRDAGP